jgi:ribose/xylose/arabinose/galactoside ABC-type transport system permease subunit
MNLDTTLDTSEQGADDALALPANWRPRTAGAALSILGVDVAAVLFFSALSGFVFLTPQSLSNIALDGSENVLLCIGVAFLLGAGELDISIGANVILSSVVGGDTMAAFADPLVGSIVGAVACIACGAAVGAFNALVVTRLRVTSFIATLASLGIVTGLAYVLTGGYNLSDVPLSLQSDFGVAKLAGVVPYPALISVAFAVAAGLLLSRTRFGLHTLALGSSREAAVRAGIKVRSRLTALFMLAGGLRGDVRLHRSQPLCIHEPERPPDRCARCHRRRGARRHQPVRRQDFDLGRGVRGAPRGDPAGRPRGDRSRRVLPAYCRGGRADHRRLAAGVCRRRQRDRNVPRQVPRAAARHGKR